MQLIDKDFLNLNTVIGFKMYKLNFFLFGFPD